MQIQKCHAAKTPQFALFITVFHLAICLIATSTLTWAQDVVTPGGQAAGPPQRSAGDGTKFIVQFTKTSSRSARALIAQQAGAAVRRDLGIIDALAVTVPNQNALNALMNNQSVRRVVPDHPLYEAAPKTPPQPTLLAATAVSASQINLAWTQPNGNNEEGTRIQRCTGSLCGNFAQVASVGANVTNYNDTRLAPNTTYTYRVIAFITSGKPSERESLPSDPAEDTTDPPPSNPPADPSNLSATAVSVSQINLVWLDNSFDEDNFEIDRCQGSGCSIFCAGSAGTGERGLRVSVDAALRAGIFKASGSIDPMGWSVGARRSFPRP